MHKLKLLGTPSSHFARKVRIVLHELAVPFDFEIVRNLMGLDSARYGQNPLMQVPTLIDGDAWVIGADYIARYVVTTRASPDPLNVLAPGVAELNQLAVLNGIMAHEVTILMAAHGGLADIMAHAYFRKLAGAITASLSWLDQKIDLERESFNYVDVTTICMWQHLVHFKTVSELHDFRRIAARVERFSARDSVAQTTPEASRKAAMAVPKPCSNEK